VNVGLDVVQAVLHRHGASLDLRVANANHLKS
jgi:hypothetical protein